MARGTPFGNRERQKGSRILFSGCFDFPAALPCLFRSPPPPVPYGVHSTREKAKSPLCCACFASGTRRSCFVRRYLSRSLIHLATEDEAGNRYRAAESINIPLLFRCLFHSRSVACIASTMASLSLAPPLWLLLDFSAARATAPCTCSQTCTLQVPRPAKQP